MTMKKTDKKSSFGMLSVKAGIDNNPNPTHADRIAGSKMKAKKAKKGKMFRNGGNVLVPFIDYKSIAGMGRKKPKNKKEEIKEKNKKVSAIVPKPKPYTSKEITSEPKSSIASLVAANPRKGFDQDDEAALSARLTKLGDARTSKPGTQPRTTGPGDTSSIMKRTTKLTPGQKARQRKRKSRGQVADFFSGFFDALSPTRTPPVLENIAAPYRRKKGGPLGVKLAKGGFKKKTPIY